MQERAEAVRVGTEDVAALGQVVEDLDPEPVEVDDLGRQSGRLQLGLELGEGRPRGRRAGTDPLEVGRTVAARRPQPGVEEASAGVEDVGADRGRRAVRSWWATASMKQLTAALDEA